MTDRSEGLRGFLTIDQAVPLGLVVAELVSNSMKYAFADRRTGGIAPFPGAGQGGVRPDRGGRRSGRGDGGRLFPATRPPPRASACGWSPPWPPSSGAAWRWTAPGDTGPP
ncbi:MAG: hypothetical protein MZV70_69465 [Desulfobacterales bacterium]|nr:hypothetical protein [Desulfobacterales bacterium]